MIRGVIASLAMLFACSQLSAQMCDGDCNENGVVEIDELVRGVNIALGELAVTNCTPIDANSDARVAVSELVLAVRGALDGCELLPTATATVTLSPANTPTPAPPFVGFDASEIARLAADSLDGRDNGTAGSLAAQELIIDQLRGISSGLDSSKSGDEAFKQAIPEGTNIVAVMRGSELPDEYLMIGAHYDHFKGCAGVCNGATDNAAGTSVVLAIARGIAALPVAPRRSIIFALWDREEDGLRGSAHYVANPLVPLSKVVAYLNFDIQGANLLPSIRNISFAVAGESGGERMLQLIQDSVRSEGLDTRPLTALFGQDRSDYINFLNRGIPTVFFSDSTGPCYHSSGDNPEIVDLGKLEKQSRIGFKLTLALAQTDTLPQITELPGIVFDDAVVINDIVNAAVAGDLALLSPADQATLLAFKTAINATVAAGPANFDGGDVLLLLGKVLELIDILTNRIPCDGFLSTAR